MGDVFDQCMVANVFGVCVKHSWDDGCSINLVLDMLKSATT